MSSDKHRILSTKPLSAELVQQAAAQGIVVSEKAFIEVRPALTAASGKRSREILQNGGVIVFTSPNAVRIVAEITENMDAVVYCIQGATREAVEQHFPNARIAGTAADSKALATLVLQNSTITFVVFFCGNIRRNELPDMLRSRNVDVEEILVYETLETPAQLTETYDGLLFFSPSSVSSFFSGNTLPAQTVCFAIGHTTAAALRKVTENKVVVSTEPSVDALLQTVILYFDNINSQE
ncbi:uroporphyrinogen-III synthase [Chitinophaga cymbidii]|uniref:Tetrapyrrole biosynthesis uroporphyrinogen III synthase domain-containing protein n=1 Tax=Chitinophaga cymbidii TaxID=1096750 RepID=A0A512RLH9_9BACT|nr:uroporphyrinogen-III synthase [Chitinophaga cymbidii]GEP96546.1 hypothetical protein CCY01nite_28060 [Chitinophaga cymbidii]